jgi:type IV pilus assembly protein PilC
MLYVFKRERAKNNKLHKDFILSEEPPKDCLSFRKIKKFSLSTRDLHNLSYYIHSLLSIPLPISEVIRILSLDYPHFLSQVFLRYIYKNLLDGKKLSNTLRFSGLTPFFVHRTYIGEEAGDLLTAFHDIEKFLMQKIAFEEEIKKSTKYPCFLFMMLCGVLFVFGAVFTQFSFFTYLPVLFVLFSFVIWFLVKKNVFEFLFQKYWIVQTLMYLGYLLKAYIPLIRAISITKESFQKESIKTDLTTITHRIEGGYSFAQSAKGTFLDTKTLQEVFYCAEKKGDYATFFLKVSDYIFKEWMASIRRILSMLEPTLIVIIGCIILWVVMFAILPLYDDMALMSQS